MRYGLHFFTTHRKATGLKRLSFLTRHTAGMMVTLLFLFVSTVLHSQHMGYNCFQIGNDYSGYPVWVPHNVADVFVTPEGTVYTNVYWEEGGGNVAEIHPDGTMDQKIYVGNHGGGSAITANATHLYFAGDAHRVSGEGIDRRRRTRPTPETNLHVNCGSRVYGLALSSSRVYASVRDANAIRVYDLDLEEKASEDISLVKPEDLYLDGEGKLWVLQPSTNKIIRLDPATKNTLNEIQLPAHVVPTDIAIDEQNRMYVSDAGINEQIRIYRDITSHPVFDGTFGQQGGILSGTPGLYAPLKFDMPVGVGVDRNGNIHVGNRAGSGNGSTLIQKYTPMGEMVWDLKCVLWIDMVAPLPGNENILYGSGEKIKVDYGSREWALQALTLNKHAYPDDFRHSGKGHSGATWIRELYGRKYMFLTDMSGTMVNVYRFDGEITVPSGHISTGSIWYDADGDGQRDRNEVESQSTGSTRGVWVDTRGDIWQASRNRGIYKYTLQGVDEHGGLIYSRSGRQHVGMPSPFRELRRIRFYPEKDSLLVINGFTHDYPNIGHHWKRAGKVFRGYKHWKGTFGEPDWEIIPPFEDLSGHNGGDGNVQVFEMVDEYIFMAHNGSSSKLNVSRGEVSIYREDGTYLGKFRPSREMGHIGIIDVTEGMTAWKTSWGAYIVAIEDDGRSKVVMYQWCPTGGCIPSSMDIRLTTPEKDTLLMTYDDIVLVPDITKDTCVITRVEYYAGEKLLGTVKQEPYAFTLPDTNLGRVAFRAKLIAAGGAYKWSNTRPATVSSGTPVVTINTRKGRYEYNAVDTIQLVANAFDYDGKVDSVQFYAGGRYLGSSQEAPYACGWMRPDTGRYSIQAVAYDDSLRQGRSTVKDLTVFGYRSPAHPEQTSGGVIYSWYEGNWDALPDFNNLYANRIDSISSFHLGKKETDDGFAVRFRGYIDIRHKGTYTFYTESDDGSQLYIGDRLIVDNGGAHGLTREKGRIMLEPGLHPIAVSMFDASSDDALVVSYRGPALEKQQVPASVLYRPSGSKPLVTVEKPADSIRVNEGEPVTFRAAVTDKDEDVYKLEWYREDTLLGSYADRNDSLVLDSLAGGRYTITVRAYDLTGAVTESGPVHLTVNARPRLRFTSPEPLSSHSSADTVRVTLFLQDENTREVQLLVNGKAMKALHEPPWSFQLAGLDKGTHYLRAKVVDEDGMEGEAKTEIRVYNAEPVISIVQPAPKSLFKEGDQVTFRASLEDHDGDVYKIAFYEEGRQLGDNANIFHETTVQNMSPGVHRIVAKAYDKKGAMTRSEPVYIAVNDFWMEFLQPAGREQFVVGDTVTIAVSMENEAVQEVHFYANNLLLGSKATAPWQWDWIVLEKGRVSLNVEALDAEGQKAVTGPRNIEVTGSSGTYPLQSDNSYRIQLYPNPLENGYLTIAGGALFQGEKRVHIRIRDITGRVVYDRTHAIMESSVRLPVSHFRNKGLYLITIQTEAVVVNKKLLVR